MFAITHHGKQILLIDLTNCGPEEMTKIAGKVQQLVTTQSSKSVLTLSDFTGARFSRAAFTRMKEVAVFDRPFVKQAAFVGAESLPKVFYEGLKTFSQVRIPQVCRAGGSDELVDKRRGAYKKYRSYFSGRLTSHSRERRLSTSERSE